MWTLNMGPGSLVWISLSSGVIPSSNLTCQQCVCILNSQLKHGQKYLDITWYKLRSDVLIVVSLGRWFYFTHFSCVVLSGTCRFTPFLAKPLPTNDLQRASKCCQPYWANRAWWRNIGSSTLLSGAIGIYWWEHPFLNGTCKWSIPSIATTPYAADKHNCCTNNINTRQHKTHAGVYQ